MIPEYLDDILGAVCLVIITWGLFHLVPILDALVK